MNGLARIYTSALEDFIPDKKGKVLVCGGGNKYNSV